MNTSAESLIAALGLAPHPEGGHYRETYRSAAMVQPADARPERPALTTIYFLLTGSDLSRWHRVASEEVWHFLDGAPLELRAIDADFVQASRHVIGAVRDGLTPEHVVRAGDWQAARSLGDWTLVSCVVAPGFDFADFEMLRDRSGEALDLRRRHPDLAGFV